MKSPERTLAELAVSKLPPKRTRYRHGKLIRFRKPAGSMRLHHIRQRLAVMAPKRPAVPVSPYVRPCAPVKIRCRYQLALLTRQADAMDIRQMVRP